MKLRMLYESGKDLPAKVPEASLDKDDWVAGGKTVSKKHYTATNWQHGKPQKPPKGNTPARTRALGSDDNEYKSHILTSHGKK